MSILSIKSLAHEIASSHDDKTSSPLAASSYCKFLFKFLILAAAYNPLSSCLLDCIYKPFPHYSAFACSYCIGYILAGNALKHIFLDVAGLFDEPNPVWQFPADALPYGNLNLRRVDKAEIMHGKHRVPIDYRASSDKRNGLGIMVIRGRKIVVQSIDAATAPLKTTNGLPSKQLLSMDA